MDRDIHRPHPSPGVLLGVSSLALGALLYGLGPNRLATLAPGTAGCLLQANGAGAPTWVDIYAQANTWTAAQTITSAGSYLGLETAQATAPATPTAGFRLYADATHRLSWKGQNGFVRTFDGVANTADRTYTLPNASGTVGLLEVANTWTGAQAISNTTASTSTTTGALTVAGGAGFAGDISLGGIIKIKGNAAAEISAQPASVTGGQASNLSVGARRYDANGQGLVAYIDFRGADGSGNQTTGAMDFYLRPNSAVGSEAAEKVAAWTAGNSVLGGKLAILQTTASTSTTTGALTVSGGVGVAGNLYCGATANCVGLVSTGVASLGSTSTAGHTLIGNTSHAIRTSTATTANQDDVLLVQARTTGTAAAGFGAAIRMQAYSSIGADRTQGSIVAEWVVATDASRTGRIRLLASDSTASREGLRIDATGSAALIGFLGATAVARQTLGAAATDAATTQTLANNIRTALINLGLGQT